MIAHLKGSLAQKSEDHVIVDVGGVGYHVLLSLNSYEKLPPAGSEISLHIHTHVREDQLQLFGFVSHEEKAIFQRLLNVSGIGPKMAISILSGLSPHDIVDAVIKEDIVRLNAVPGIGRKTAERIIVDLRDKFLKEFGSLQKTDGTGNPLYNDVLSALINLGYSRAVAEKAITCIEFPKDATVQTAVKLVLKEIGNKR